jgi:hypothetical protein
MHGSCCAQTSALRRLLQNRPSRRPCRCRTESRNLHIASLHHHHPRFPTYFNDPSSLNQAAEGVAQRHLLAQRQQIWQRLRLLHPRRCRQARAVRLQLPQARSRPSMAWARASESTVHPRLLRCGDRSNPGPAAWRGRHTAPAVALLQRLRMQRLGAPLRWAHAERACGHLLLPHWCNITSHGLWLSLEHLCRQPCIQTQRKPWGEVLDRTSFAKPANFAEVRAR